MIRWKIVKKYERGSCYLPKNCKYFKTYKKGIIVKATRGTLGIFVFKTKKFAEDFIIDYLASNSQFQILKVKSIGKGRSPKLIANFIFLLASQDINMFYEEGILAIPPPDGTICYPAVKVLD